MGAFWTFGTLVLLNDTWLNGSKSADCIFRVVNFVFHYLRHFSINFKNYWAHLAANFLNVSKHPNYFLLIGMVFKQVMDEKTKMVKVRKYANLGKSWNLTFFECGICQLFFSFLLPKNTITSGLPPWMVKRNGKHQENSPK